MLWFHSLPPSLLGHVMYEDPWRNRVRTSYLRCVVYYRPTTYNITRPSKRSPTRPPAVVCSTVVTPLPSQQRPIHVLRELHDACVTGRPEPWYEAGFGYTLCGMSEVWRPEPLGLYLSPSACCGRMWCGSTTGRATHPYYIFNIIIFFNEWYILPSVHFFCF